MAANGKAKRAIRIGGASGGFTDRVRAISRLAADRSVDAIVGDWLSENVMTGYGAGKERRRQLEKERGSPLTFQEKVQNANYASTFLQCFEPAIPLLKKNGAKLVVNAGANDTELLAEVVKKMCGEKAGWEANVAWIEGDEVTDQFRELASQGHEFTNLCDGRTLQEWGFEPLCAQAYLGSLGISEALKQGADIVICGRVSDAAPTIGLSAWWHRWESGDWDRLAGALVAGHLIECSAFITGGYYSGFKDLMKDGKHLNLGFPIAEVEESGECVITKEPVSRCSILATPRPSSEERILTSALTASVEYRRRRQPRNHNLSTCLRNLWPTLLQLGCRRQPRKCIRNSNRPRPRPCLRHHWAATSTNNPRWNNGTWRIPGGMALLPCGLRYAGESKVDGRTGPVCDRRGNHEQILVPEVPPARVHWARRGRGDTRREHG